MHMKKVLTYVISGMIGLTLSTGARAADPAKDAPKAAAKKDAAGKGDPTGSWTWSAPGRDGQTQERKATLKREGDKVLGSISGRNGEQPIEEGKIKDGEITFKVVRERNGQKMTQQFQGKIEGDLIKGTMTMNRGDGERSLPWEAKRGAAATPASATTPAKK
jgi:hypothetical protein